ncbi:Pentatricopeptide repeat-containing protein, partial [Thalictrum thalictroides]
MLYSRNESSLNDARKLFYEIPERSIPAYAVLIMSFSRAKRWEDVISLVVLMIHQGLQPDKFLIPSVLKACSALENLNFGRMVHGYTLRSKLELDVFVGNALIDMYANCGDLACSRTFFDLMPEQDVVSWTAMVSAYMDFGYIDEGKKLFHTMQLIGVKPDVISWNALVSGFAFNGEIDEALRLLDEMRETGLRPGVSSWNGVIS